MRHMLMGGMHGGMAGFMLMGMLRRTVTKLLLAGLLIVVVVLWFRLRQERARNRGEW